MTPGLRFVALLVLAGCSTAERAASETAKLVSLPSPAGSRSSEPYLATDAAGAVHMTWVEKTGDSTHAVRYARLDGDAWSAPSTIVERRDLFDDHVLCLIHSALDRAEPASVRATLSFLG